MTGCEHRFPKTLIEFQAALRAKARARAICSGAGGRRDLSALDAATDGDGCCGPSLHL